MNLKTAAKAINDKSKRAYFTSKVDALIVDCLGIYAEALSPNEYLGPNEEVKLSIEVIRRESAQQQLTLQNIKIGGQTIEVKQDLEENKKFSQEIDFTVPTENSQPYWLRKPYQNLFDVKDQVTIGKPENDAVIEAVLSFTIDGQLLQTKAPLVYKFSDRVEGEIIRPVIITPPFVVSANTSNLIFTNDKAQEITLSFKMFNTSHEGISFSAEGWEITPSYITYEKPESGKFDFTISVKPLPGAKTNTLSIKNDKGEELTNLYEIDYSHIDKRLVYESVAPKLVKIDLERKGSKIGYIPGAGDKVAEAIEYMGYAVDILDQEKLKSQDLSQYQAIVAGIRAYNTEKWLPEVKDVLMDYVSQGGNYIVQYNTRSRDLLSLDIGPYPFTISRERVTEEDAEVNFLLPKHSVLNTPNKLDAKDFEGWVQERGLYFASKWDDGFKAPIGWHDKDEPSRNGGLIVADHGKGAFIYTGISFFREVPSGVPGAYRLLANLLSYTNTSNNE